MDVIKIQNFLNTRHSVASGDLIDGFENFFTFYYPDDEYPGTLYKYNPSGTPSKELFSRAAPRYSPTSLHIQTPPAFYL